MLDKISAKNKMNKLGQLACPFLFFMDYKTEQCYVSELSNIKEEEIRFQVKDTYIQFQNFKEKELTVKPAIIPHPVDFEIYKTAFDRVKNELLLGNSFLTNLTVETPITLNIGLEEVIFHAKAKYKLWVKDQFVCFSPESFVSVNPAGVISSFPMKGTLTAKEFEAGSTELLAPKEYHEHTTIVDLIRNDLSKICDKVWVERFRYLDFIKKQNGEGLYQVSSEVSGQLPTDWKSNMGDWFMELLPAGSITGAPKAKTLEIIAAAEKKMYKNGERGFYTGVFRIFDGESFTSSVMIRFIENQKQGLVYKSGGGITHQSVAEKEYLELIHKIYVPVF